MIQNSVEAGSHEVPQQSVPLQCTANGLIFRVKGSSE